MANRTVKRNVESKRNVWNVLRIERTVFVKGAEFSAPFKFQFDYIELYARLLLFVKTGTGANRTRLDKRLG